MSPVKLLLDTDIGSDIDDAVCLAYLLANEDCELLGITTCSGQVEERAKLASALCYAAGKFDLPVFPGAESPVSGPQRQPLARYSSVLPRWPHRQTFEQGRAVQFLAEQVHAHPGEVTLLGIGPMTNIATLFRDYPEVPGKLKALMLMAGRFGPKPPNAGRDEEWNVYCDPEAAAITYRAIVPSHRSVGLDVTLKVQMPAGEVRRRFSGHALLKPVLDMAEVWYSEAGVMTFHDPLTAACLFDADMCGFDRGRVAIETTDTGKLGATRWSPDLAGPHEAAFTVDPQRFFDRYFSVFGYLPSLPSP